MFHKQSVAPILYNLKKYEILPGYPAAISGKDKLKRFFG